MSIPKNSKNYELDLKRHSFAHLLSAAVGQMFPEAQFGVGPVIDTGCYYDFILPRTLIPEDLPLIEKKIKEMLKQPLVFKVQEMELMDAIALFEKMKQPLKVELLNDLATRGTTSMSEEEKADFGDDLKITIYRLENEKTGEDLFVDLCKGPHVEGREGFSSLRSVGFKLDKFSGSYWRGDQERNIQMQRIYALVMEDKEVLKKFISDREEAKKRDHRVLGQQLKLFTISDLIGAGLPLLQPNGMKIRQSIENYLWQLHRTKGYQRVWTPHIAKISLYETSGHAAKFGDELFRVKGKDDAFIMKPMNCPHHMQIFDDNQFSYRDMPVRYFEPATVYRDEKTGQLSGLTRVRSITQDDGHLFCRVSQIKEEVSTIVSIVREFYDTLGMQPDWVSLSVRDPNDPDKYLGSDEVWNEAEKALEEAAKENDLPYKRVEGEAAFYGPKLDFMFKDALNREWQLSTIQADFNLPQRFDLSFKNENGEDEKPVVIHRAISGSLERFLGVMIEHFGGWFPFWLAPEQIRILTVNNESEITEYVSKIKNILNETELDKPLKNNPIRFEVDDRNESLGKKIREATMMKIPMMLIVGPKDVEAGEVSVRTRDGEKKVKIEGLREYLGEFN
jgi:threonyl-tRNA synthetase